MGTKIACKHCQSSKVIKFGTHEGIQRYWCKDCKRKFIPNNALAKMKTPVNVIASAVGMYFGGMPLDSIQRQLEQDFKIRVSESGIYNWVVRFSRDAVRQAKDFKPKVGGVFVADETVIKTAGRNIWFWDIMDANSRYLLATHISTTRTTEDAKELVEKAAKVAGKIPKVIVTDKLQAYIDGIELAFGSDTKHIQSKPFETGSMNNLIERFHGTLKDRTNVVRGFKNMATAKLLSDAWLVHYNFLKEHTALGNMPPAQAMGKTPFKNWVDIIKTARTAPEFKLAHYTVSTKLQRKTAKVTSRKTPQITRHAPRITPKLRRITPPTPRLIKPRIRSLR